MTLKWIGAALVVGSCGGWGMVIAAAHCNQEAQLRRLSSILQTMQWELRYRLTELPQLCRIAARECRGVLHHFFLDLARELDWMKEAEASDCMNTVLSRYGNLPPKVKRILRSLGRTMGRYDLEGQLQGMDAIIAQCSRELSGLGKDREIRLRSYKTLGLCAGAALVILFL
ncbi:MAG: stage III sporulation protein AB [Oscillospiraceae bacterium]|nr:stage III sporulation protein AB [Oscillospiraceae bacterium]